MADVLPLTRPERDLIQDLNLEETIISMAKLSRHGSITQADINDLASQVRLTIRAYESTVVALESENIALKSKVASLRGPKQVKTNDKDGLESWFTARLSDTKVRSAYDLWHKLMLSLPSLPIPAALIPDTGGVQLAWSRQSHYVEINFGHDRDTTFWYANSRVSRCSEYGDDMSELSALVFWLRQIND
jgi:hypothetical protein